MSSSWSLRRPWDNEYTMVLEREGEMGCWGGRVLDTSARQQGATQQGATQQGARQQG